MRTTLTIDDDVLAVAKAMAARRRQSVGVVLSELARSALRPPSSRRVRNGVTLLPVSRPEAVVTLEVVNALRDEAP